MPMARRSYRRASSRPMHQPCFAVRKEDRFINEKVIEFVLSKLEVGDLDSAGRLQSESSKCAIHTD